MCLARSRMMCLCYAYRQCIFDTSVILYAHSPLRTANPLHVSIRYKTPYNSCGPWSSLQTLGGHAIFFLPRYPAINSIQLFFEGTQWQEYTLDHCPNVSEALCHTTSLVVMTPIVQRCLDMSQS